MRGLNWQTWHLRLTAGMNQKVDARSLESPELAICKNVMFDKAGGLQTRYPFAAMANAPANPRTIVENGPELLCFTKDALHSWNAQQSAWIEKGTHLATKVEETPVFVATGEQYACDRAELDGTIVYVWSDETKGGIVAAAVDKETGATLVPPTYFLFSGVARVVALDTKILLVTAAPGIGPLYGVRVRAIDPADPATGILSTSTSVVGALAIDGNPDIVKIPGSDAALLACPTTSGYTVAKITAGLTVTTSAKARTADDAIAVAVDPTGTSALVLRCVNTGATAADPRNIKSDRINASTLADAVVDTALATTVAIVNQITAEFRSVQTSGSYRAYAFWSDSESDQPELTGGVVSSNWIDLTDTTGTAATFVPALGVASRAFDYDGNVYVNLVFAGASNFLGGPFYGQRSQLQNTYFLYRDDAFLVAKMVMQRAGGFQVRQGHLPGVAVADGAYSWCGTERRIIPLGGKAKGYADRGPRDITLTFDSNEARRCVRLGQTLYISGGEILQYDGVRLVEVGSHTYPYFFEGNPFGAGNMQIGTYAYKGTYRYQNSRGEVERSTTATVGGAEVTGGPLQTLLQHFSTLVTTHKTENPPAIELWRTLKNPTDDAPFYLVTSNDPVNASTTNGYITNDATASSAYPGSVFTDNLSDEDLRDLESNPENGAVLENMSPPPALLIAASSTRIFLAGIAGDPDRVWYSKQRGDGEVAAFHEALTADVPRDGGDITALALLLDTLVVFRERAIYVLPGDGFDNTLGGQNLGPARAASIDVGAVNQESVAVTDRGIVFHSSKGKWLLNKGFQLEYIGDKAADYDNETPLAVQAVASRHEVRWLTSARMLVWNTLMNQWSEWTIADGISACSWNGQHVYLTSTASKLEQTSYTGVDYGMDIELAWVKLADLQGYGKVDHFQVLGEYRSAHRLQIRCARDYWKDGEGTYFQNKAWTVSPTTVGARETVKHAPSIKQLEALKIRITVLGPGTDDAPSGEAIRLTGISFELGFETGLNRQLPSAQRQ